MTERRRTPRVGFTLIELLVVMAIIVILMAVLTVGIGKVMTRTAQAQTQQDIIELAQALESFKADHGGFYPPSSLNTRNVMTVMPKLFPGLNPKFGDPTPAITLAANIDKALSPLGLSSSNVDLQGDQCLVLFLGGRHVISGGIVTEVPNGFSANSANPFISPTDITETVKDPNDPNRRNSAGRIAPYFKFKISRLFQRNPNVAIASYGDGFFGNTYGGSAQNSCYAYFSTSFVVPSNTNAGVGNYNDTDCNRMIDGTGTNYPRPFVNLNSTTRITIKFEYANPKSFQIISPGPDTLYGTAFKFPASKTPQNSTDPSYIGANTAGSSSSADNFSNFYDGRLGES